MHAEPAEHALRSAAGADAGHDSDGTGKVLSKSAGDRNWLNRAL